MKQYIVNFRDRSSCFFNGSSQTDAEKKALKMFPKKKIAEVAKEKALSAMNKDELLAKANEVDAEITADMTNAELVDSIKLKLENK